MLFSDSPAKRSLKYRNIETSFLPTAMKIFVNDIEIDVFTGANAVDAVISYFRSIQSPLPDPLPMIFDQYGNIIEQDGELSPGNQIIIIESENTSANE